MDHTAGPILEIGLLLLGAVVAGWIARRIGLPAVVGYLALGIPFATCSRSCSSSRSRP